MDQKEYSFWSKNGPKGVLLLVKKEYSFSFKIPPEGVLLLVKKEVICHMDFLPWEKGGE